MKNSIVILITIAIISCSFQKNKKETFKTYFPNGKLKAITEMENGKKNGKEVLYWENGNIYIVQYFRDDMLVDSFYQYYENRPGVISLKGYCLPKSHIIALDTNGEMTGENYYKEKMVGDGPVKLYFKNRKTMSISEYKEGKQNGVDILYYPNGNIRRIQHFKDGVQVPPVIKFDSLGMITEYKAAKD